MSAARAKPTKPKGKASKKKPRKRKAPSPAQNQKFEQTRPREDELVLAWFRLLGRRRGAWLQHLWLSEAPLEGRATVTHAELAGILADEDSPVAEAEWSKSEEPVKRWLKEAEEIKSTLDRLENSRFQRLARVFGLTTDEMELLQLCTAVAFDPQLGRVCAYLQDHSGRTYLTEELATRLLGKGRSTVWVAEMNVFRWELIQRSEIAVGEPNALICDPQIKEWLLEKSTLDEQLVGAVRLIETNEMVVPPEWPIDEITAWIEEFIAKPKAPRLRVVVVAPSGAGKRTFAAAVSKRLKMPLLMVDADLVEESNWLRFFLHAERQVFLDPAALAWSGEAASRRAWPSTQSLFPIQFVLCEPGSDLAPLAGVIDRQVRLPMPAAATREKLWRQYSPAAAKWRAAERQQLAEEHSVWPGDIKRASYLGVDTAKSAALIVRKAARSRFGNLAQILECPFTKDDLVVPEGLRQLLEAIIFEAEERAEFWRQPEARRLFPQGRGLTVLFSGPSGTGKTMSAQVIAAELDKDLCRVNVAQLVSKWVGETSKNVEQVVRVAAENDVVLFFDEADALFARRATEIRDAQDRFANTDTAFLLQALETFPGVAILATNLKANIDPAFLRRLRYLVEFPKPNPFLQQKLWTKLVAALATQTQAAELEPVIDLLSKAVDVTGAQIKFAVLGALFEARAEAQKLNARHLLTGLDRELGKEGRALGPKEREQILRGTRAA